MFKPCFFVLFALASRRFARGSVGGLVAVILLSTSAAAQLSAEKINRAVFDPTARIDREADAGPDPLVVKLQTLLDRANASPGVIDGYRGENLAKAIRSFETSKGIPVDGLLDQRVWKALGGTDAGDVIQRYELTTSDLDHPFVDSIPTDYADRAQMNQLGFTSLEEMLAERFHMDIDLFNQLNGDVDYAAGATVFVANPVGSPPQTKVDTIEADKEQAEIRGYDQAGRLVVSYPATIGSAENPSPSGTHEVKAIAPDPVYYYRPSVNFQQGDNTEPLELPPGPNNPVGTVWIDLTEPGYGIHGTPEPAEIDKEASHGCVRLTNWDAEELASLVEPGVTVRFSP